MTIDNVGLRKTHYQIFDLLKGFWQIPLADRAKEISAFVTPDGLYKYIVMPFGMKNSPATFQRLTDDLMSPLDGCELSPFCDMKCYQRVYMNIDSGYPVGATPLTVFMEFFETL